ncbi:unnamed protein product [Cladocopium goreaui]|uniref:NADP-dependent glyceraldehyde-3-phosphate dehydrogenase n=1 Tax=Cladocopium goreaui TaxID=2562237 RepID=A0A9P1GED8_9DINO|nr:unnamed protein product [Cladocopium goreaui]
MAPAPESAPESVAVKFDIKAKMENAQNGQNAIEAKKEEPRESKIQNQSTGTLPEKPVRLYVNREDHHLGHLEVYSYDHVGLLFKICELLTSHGVDICSASINTENGVVYNQFEVRIARPSDTAACVEWCRELEELLEKTRGSAFDNSLANVSKRLSVNPDLVSVVSFVERPPQREELCYKLVLEGINQAGLLTYTALVLYRCGFSIATATISTTEGHIVDTFELTTTSAESESLLRSYLDVPMPTSAGQEKTKEVMPLPFHAVESDADLQVGVSPRSLVRRAEAAQFFRGCRTTDAIAGGCKKNTTTQGQKLRKQFMCCFPFWEVATDDAMRKNLDETLRRGLVKSRYRLLVDASSHGLGVGEAKQQLQGTESKLPELSLYSGPTACPSFPEIITEMYLVTERPSTKAARELRRSLAVAGTPVMFDLAYHPDFRKRKGRSNGADGENNFSSALAGTLTMQLFELEMPDPFRQEMIKITAPMPKVFAACHLSAFVAQTQNEDCHELHNELTVLTCAECVVIYFSPEGANVNEQSLSRVNSLGELLDQVQAFEGKMQTLLVPLSMLCWLLLGKDRCSDANRMSRAGSFCDSEPEQPSGGAAQEAAFGPHILHTSCSAGVCRAPALRESPEKAPSCQPQNLQALEYFRVEEWMDFSH